LVRPFDHGIICIYLSMVIFMVAPGKSLCINGFSHTGNHVLIFSLRQYDSAHRVGISVGISFCYTTLFENKIMGYSNRNEMNASVCMATHNGEAFIREQVDSILNQLEEEDELIISDDDSTDNTLSILHSYDDPRISILPSNKFGSPSRNFEYILSHSKNEAIFLADQDDVWHRDKIKIMKEHLQIYDLVVCDCRITDEHLNVIEPSFFGLNNSGTGLLKNFIKSSFIGCCMGFRFNVLKRAMPFPKGIPMHDQWIGLIAQKYFEVKFYPHALVDHRRHKKNYSTTGERSKNSLAKKLVSRVQLAQNLLWY
jgi:glycosyltransferase involved in cell wall biosynthesis